MNLLSSSEQEILVSLLSKLSPGFLPQEIFFQMCRLNVLSAFEIIPLRMKEGKVEVLLTERPDNDLFWGGQWHTPGSIILSTDTPDSLNDVKERVLKELNYPQEKYCDLIYSSMELKKWKRGMTISIYHYLEVEENYGVGRFFPVDELPENIVENQAEVIERVAGVYRGSLGTEKSENNL